MSRLSVRRLTTRLWNALSSERGDVPGWVLVTLMTAGLVATIWALASEQLTALFKDALTKVKGK